MKDEWIRDWQRYIPLQSEDAIFSVIQNVLAVIRRDQILFKALQDHGTPAKVFEDLIDEELQLMQVYDIFIAFRENTSASSSSMPAKGRARGRSRSRSRSTGRPQSKKQAKSASRSEPVLTSMMEDDAAVDDEAVFDEEEESKEARDARKAKEQKEVEKKAEEERHQFVKRYLDEERNFGSSDSSDHPCPPVRAKKLPEKCDWPNASGSDAERGFLHETRNRSGSGSSSYGDGKRIQKKPRKKEEEKRKKRQRSPPATSATRRDDTRLHKAKGERRSSPLETSERRRGRSRSKRPRIKLIESRSSGPKGKEKGKSKGKSKDPNKGKGRRSRRFQRGI